MFDEFPSLSDGAASGFTFDPVAHRYYLDGRPLAGVTEILRGVGVAEDSRWFTPESRERGKQVHRAMELLVRGQLDWNTVDERIAGYVRAGERFCRECEVEIGAADIETERLVCSRTYRYGGKLDAILRVFGRRSICDWKTGAVGHAAVQTSAYLEAYLEERRQVASLPRFGVKLNQDGTYKMAQYKNNSLDFELFRACALIYNTYHLPIRKDEQ